MALSRVRRVRADLYNSSPQLSGGTSKAQIILDDLSNPWVVKSINSPQGALPGIQATFNDYLGGRLAELVGFPIVEVGIMELDSGFLDDYPFLRDPAYGSFTEGEHFACMYYPGCSTLEDFSTRKMVSDLQTRCTNRQDINLMSAFDSCTSNADRAYFNGLVSSENLGNLIFHQTPTGLQLKIIDHGFCFTGPWENNTPALSIHDVGAWPLLVFGLFKIFTQLGWFDESNLLAGVTALQAIPLVDLQAIVGEMPAGWKRFTTPTHINEMLVYLISRIASYDIVVRRAFLPTHTGVLKS